MPNKEFESWRIWHDKINPIGEYREDLRAGSMVTPLYDLLQLLAQQYLQFKPPGYTTMFDWVLDWMRETDPKRIAELRKKIEKKKTQSVEDFKFLMQAKAEGEKIRKLRAQGKWKRGDKV